MNSLYSPSIDPSIQPSVHSCAAVCIHNASESITWFRQNAECHRHQPQKHSKSRKLLLTVMIDKKEYIHHTIHLSNTSLPYNTINKTTNKKARGRLSHARGRTGRLQTIYTLSHQINL